MMAKIVYGSNFKGVVDYILDKDKGVQKLISDGLFMENKDTIAMSFNIQSQMNGKVAKPVGHIALSFSREDEPRLTNHVMAGIALEYMERMGIRDTQFFIARHFDKEHPHVHIAFNRIGNDGRTISDRNEERMNLKPKIYTVDTPSTTSDTARGELFNGSLGLLNGNGSSCNAADAEANQEMAEILRRKKKRRRGMRL